MNLTFNRIRNNIKSLFLQHAEPLSQHIAKLLAMSVLLSRPAACLLLTFYCVSLPFSVQAQLPAPALGGGENTSTEAPRTVESSSPLPPAAATPVPPRVAAPRTTPSPTARPKTQKAPALKPLSIGGVSIRGLNDLGVIKKIRAAHQDKLRAYVELWDGESAQRLRRAELGASIPYYKLLADARILSDIGGDVPLRFEVDLDQAIKAMKTLAKKINRRASTTTIDIDSAGNVLSSGGAGVTLAVEGSALRVKAALENEPPQSYAELVVARQPGTGNSSRFKYLLAQYSTPYDAGIRGRTKNLKMAAQNVNGTVVEAGKVFSTNNAIGPRNAANGWKEAKMFVSGQIVDGVGAGICQCSTTIYNAALLANLPIVERHPHSFRVTYAPASRDAAIYWGQKDMRFRNNTGGPIYVQTIVKGSRFHVRLYGTQPVQANVTIESNILSRKNGTRSQAYRIVSTPTGAKRELLSRDYYKPKPRS